MCQNWNKGFILLEMLVALNILLFICLTLIPSYTFILNERRNIDTKHIGNELLSIELKEFIEGERSMTNRTIEVDETMYFLTWENNEEVHKPRACISWKDRSDRINERCGYGYK